MYVLGTSSTSDTNPLVMKKMCLVTSKKERIINANPSQNTVLAQVCFHPLKTAFFLS